MHCFPIPPHEPRMGICVIQGNPLKIMTTSLLSSCYAAKQVSSVPIREFQHFPVRSLEGS